jgi:hypothetical protein
MPNIKTPTHGFEAIDLLKKLGCQRLHCWEIATNDWIELWEHLGSRRHVMIHRNVAGWWAFVDRYTGNETEAALKEISDSLEDVVATKEPRSEE